MTATWTPDLHPRDTEGRFARKGLFHHTRPERAEAIRKGGFRIDVEREHGSLFGVGVNVSTDERSARLYNTESTKFVTGYDAERLDLEATVRNPYVVKVPTGSPRPGDYLDKQMRRDGILGKGETIGRGLYDPTRGQQITATLRARGYDAIEVREVGGISHEVGGNQLIVFDPEAVRVTPSAAPPAPKKAPAPKRPAPARKAAPRKPKAKETPAGISDPKATAANLRESADQMERLGLTARAQIMRDAADELDPR